MKTIILICAALLTSPAFAGSSSNSGATSSSQAVAATGAISNSQQQGQAVGQSMTFNSTSASELKTVGNPGAVSYGVSFSQYNCASTAAAGGGGMGVVLQLGGPVESGPCNARANASALFQLSASLATSDPARSAKLFNAAVLLLGNSTPETREALKSAGVSEWAPTPQGALAEACTGGYCGTDPIVKARLGVK